jgi:quercetin dioxygenase-like cupin family protein
MDGETIMLVEVHFEANTPAARHSHPHEQITYVAKGRMKFIRDQEEIIVKAGESIRMPSNVPHEAASFEESVLLDFFSPPREDFRK